MLRLIRFKLCPELICRLPEAVRKTSSACHSTSVSFIKKSKLGDGSAEGKFHQRSGLTLGIKLMFSSLGRSSDGNYAHRKQNSITYGLAFIG